MLDSHYSETVISGIFSSKKAAKIIARSEYHSDVVQSLQYFHHQVKYTELTNLNLESLDSKSIALDTDVATRGELVITVKKVVKGKLFQLRRNHRMLKLIRCGSRKYLAPTQGGIVEIPGGGGGSQKPTFFFLKGKYE